MGIAADPGIPIEIAGGVVNQALRDLGRRTYALAGDVTTRVSSRVPEMAPDEPLLTASRGCIDVALTMLREGIPGHDLRLAGEMVLYVEDIVRRGLDVGLLLTGCRIGGGWKWEIWSTAICERMPDPRRHLPLLHASSEFFLGYYETFMRQVLDEYQAASRRWHLTGAAREWETAREALSSPVVDMGRASHALGYPLWGHHLGLAIRIDDTIEDPHWAPRPISGIANELRKAMSNCAMLVIPDGMTTWLWLGDSKPLNSDALVAAAQALTARAAVRIGIGDPGHSLEGFRRTHSEAREALRVTVLGARSRTRVAQYGRVALAALMSADRDRAWCFMERTLGGLAAPNDATRRIRATVKIFLEEGSSTTRTARRLQIHRNTVAYRLRRAEEILGRPLDRRRLELEAALALATTFYDNGADGEPSLPTSDDPRCAPIESLVPELA